MENKDYNLKEKRKEIYKWVKKNFPDSISKGCLDYIFGEIEKQDKEFIKRLKEEFGKITGSWGGLNEIVDTLAGEELAGGEE